MTQNPNHPTTAPLRQKLLSLIHAIDKTLTRLSLILRTTSGLDTILLTLSYTLSLLHSRLDRHLTARLQRLAVRFAKGASEVLLPGETVVATVDLLSAADNTNDTKTLSPFTAGDAPGTATLPLDDGTLSLHTLASLSASTKAVVDMCADVRVFMRLWGLLGIYQSAKRMLVRRKDSDSDSLEDSDTPLRVLAVAQLLCSTAFQVLENGAYLAQRGVLNGRSWTAEKQARWWLWSARCWAGCVAIEGCRLGREWVVKGKVEGERGGLSEKEDGGKGRRTTTWHKADSQRWWQEALVNTAYAPMTVHYSLPGGLVSEEWISVLGTAVGVLSLKRLWEQTVV